MHHNYTDTVNTIAENYWGKEFPTSEAAEKAMLADKQSLAAFASVELLRRLSDMAIAMGGRPNEHHEPRIYTPCNVAEMKDVTIGERLYEYDTEEGLGEYVVVAKNEKGVCLMVRLNEFDLKYGPTTRLAGKDTRRTVEDAMLDGANKHLKIFEAEVEFANRLRNAIENKFPLDEFKAGHSGE